MAHEAVSPRFLDMRGKNDCSVRITSGAFEKMFAWVEISPHEVGGFGLVEEQDDGYLITDVALVDQDANAIETDIKPEDAARFVAEVEIPARRAHRKGQWRLWWHSHVRMAPDFSATDNLTAASRVNYNGWSIALVINKFKAMSVRVDIKEPRLVLTHVPLIIVLDQGAELPSTAVLADEFGRHVRPMSRPAPQKPEQRPGVHSPWLDHIQEWPKADLPAVPISQKESPSIVFYNNRGKLYEYITTINIEKNRDNY